MDQQYAQGMGYALTPELHTLNTTYYLEVCDFMAAAAPWLLDTAPEDSIVASCLQLELNL